MEAAHDGPNTETGHALPELFGRKVNGAGRRDFAVTDKIRLHCVHSLATCSKF